MLDYTPQDSDNAVKQTHLLNGDAHKLAEYYGNWAKSYEHDALEQVYRAPRFISDVFLMYVRHYFGPEPESFGVLDAGCGTGMVGRAIAEGGRFFIDGIDLSHEMVRQAEETGAYRRVVGGVDMNRPLDGFGDGQYDATVSCGVFTLGHVFPGALDELVRVTRSGGVVIVSTRPSYLHSSGFDEYVHTLVNGDRVEVVGYFADAPYIADESAHYWVLRVI